MSSSARDYGSPATPAPAPSGGGSFLSMAQGTLAALMSPDPSFPADDRGSSPRPAFAPASSSSSASLPLSPGPAAVGRGRDYTSVVQSAIDAANHVQAQWRDDESEAGSAAVSSPGPRAPSSPSPSTPAASSRATPASAASRTPYDGWTPAPGDRSTRFSSGSAARDAVQLPPLGAFSSHAPHAPHPHPPTSGDFLDAAMAAITEAEAMMGDTEHHPHHVAAASPPARSSPQRLAAGGEVGAAAASSSLPPSPVSRADVQAQRVLAELQAARMLLEEAEDRLDLSRSSASAPNRAPQFSGASPLSASLSSSRTAPATTPSAAAAAAGSTFARTVSPMRSPAAAIASAPSSAAPSSSAAAAAAAPPPTPPPPRSPPSSRTSPADEAIAGLAATVSAFEASVAGRNAMRSVVASPVAAASSPPASTPFGTFSGPRSTLPTPRTAADSASASAAAATFSSPYREREALSAASASHRAAFAPTFPSAEDLAARYSGYAAAAAADQAAAGPAATGTIAPSQSLGGRTGTLHFAHTRVGSVASPSPRGLSATAAAAAATARATPLKSPAAAAPGASAYAPSSPRTFSGSPSSTASTARRAATLATSVSADAAVAAHLGIPAGANPYLFPEYAYHRVQASVQQGFLPTVGAAALGGSFSSARGPLPAVTTRPTTSILAASLDRLAHPAGLRSASETASVRSGDLRAIFAGMGAAGGGGDDFSGPVHLRPDEAAAVLEALCRILGVQPQAAHTHLLPRMQELTRSAVTSAALDAFAAGVCGKLSRSLLGLLEGQGGVGAAAGAVPAVGLSQAHVLLDAALAELAALRKLHYVVEANVDEREGSGYFEGDGGEEEEGEGEEEGRWEGRGLGGGGRVEAY
jgi:hypothetical protein